MFIIQYKVNRISSGNLNWCWSYNIKPNSKSFDNITCWLCPSEKGHDKWAAHCSNVLIQSFFFLLSRPSVSFHEDSKNTTSNDFRPPDRYSFFRPGICSDDVLSSYRSTNILTISLCWQFWQIVFSLLRQRLTPNKLSK